MMTIDLKVIDDVIQLLTTREPLFPFWQNKGLV